MFQAATAGEDSQWHHFDDSSVTPIQSINNYLNLEYKSSDAYILFYKQEVTGLGKSDYQSLQL